MEEEQDTMRVAGEPQIDRGKHDGGIIQTRTAGDFIEAGESTVSEEKEE
jgi:hypothetical protein